MSVAPKPPLGKFPRHVYAWMGMDEHGSGEVGIKQGHVPAGYIPLVSVDADKVRKYKPQLQAQAARYGRKIYLVRYTVEEVLEATMEGEAP